MKPKVIKSALANKKIDVCKLLKKVTNKNKHKEVDWGEERGREYPFLCIEKTSK